MILYCLTVNEANSYLFFSKSDVTSLDKKLTAQKLGIERDQDQDQAEQSIAITPVANANNTMYHKMRMAGIIPTITKDK